MTSPSEIKLHIGGMDCANCALTLERSIQQLNGVEDAQVNFTAGTMEASGQLDLEQITGRIQALGYQVLHEDEQESQTASPEQGSNKGIVGFIRYLLADRQTAIALIGVALLLLSLPLALAPETQLIKWLLRGLHAVVIVAAGFPIARKGIRSLVAARQITIDLLMSIATIGALLIGETGEAATVILLFAIGEALEGYTAERSRDSLRGLLALKPNEATVLRPCIDCEEHIGHEGYTGGPCPYCDRHEVKLPVGEIGIGETVLVRPGERIPVDGRVTSGESTVNQAPITGESMPVEKSDGTEVFAGTINGSGVLEINVTRRAEDSTISQIVRLVEQAQSQRAPVERFIDRFAKWYTPAVVLLAVLVAIVPTLLFGQPLFDTPDGVRGWLYRALALLIVACPCALVISTPVTMVSSLTSLARRGVLVKGGAFLDTLATVKTIAFDKTGTLTEGHPVVVSVKTAACHHNGARCEACDDLLALAAAVERRSEHPLARAIVDEANNRSLSHRYEAAESVQALTGQGIKGSIQDSTVVVGSHTLFHEKYGSCEELHPLVEDAESNGHTVMLVGRNSDILGFVSVADQPRVSSQEALKRLKTARPLLRTVMLTGDNPVVAEAIAANIGHIDEVKANLLPQDKVDAVKSLQRQQAPVAMIGDGVNDAPALATANIGIAMGKAGTAQAMETADVVLMQDDLTRLPDVLRTSRRTRRIIWQNIIFSLAIKGVFLLLTIPGLATMWMAVFADMGASLLVTFNGMRMLRASSSK